MTLADFTCAGLIVPELRGQDAAAAIQELSRALQREALIPDVLPFYHDALNREFMVSTAIAAGMAFPHARLPGLKRLVVAFGRSKQSLNWTPTAGRPVRLVFLSAVPATDSTEYLSAVSGLARLTKEPRLVDTLLAAEDTAQILEVLQRVELHMCPTPEVARRAGL